MRLINPILRLMCVLLLVLVSGCRGVAPATITDWTFAPMVKQFEPPSVVRLDGKPAPAFLQGVADYYHDILTNAAGTHAIVETFKSPNVHFDAIKSELFNLDGRLLLEMPNVRARFVGADFLVAGEGRDAVVWAFTRESSTRLISLGEVFPEAKYVNDSVAVSRHGDIAAGVDRSTLVIRTREGELHRVPGVGSPASFLMAWSGDGKFLVVTNEDDRTFVVGRDGRILAKWRRYILVWNGFGERSFVCSESERCFVAEVNADYSWSQRGSLDWDASCSVMASPDGSVVWLGDVNRGHLIYKRGRDGGYQRVEIPSGRVIGLVRTDFGEARKER
ncbi:MAG: hypothetical protein U0638_12845 [Phycisphaerales bacterium]